MNDILVDNAMNWIDYKYRIHGEWVDTMQDRTANDNLNRNWRYQ